MQRRLTPAVKLPFFFDPLKLRNDLLKINLAEWQPHFNQAIYEGEWSAVPLRVNEASQLNIYSDPNPKGEWINAPKLQECPYFQKVINAFQCPLLSVRLLKLAPGALIKPHKDYFLGLDYGEVRLHVVVVTNSKTHCKIGGQNYHWQAGESWYGDFGQIHSFANNGEIDRIHMVIDCKVNDWLVALLSMQLAVPD